MISPAITEARSINGHEYLGLTEGTADGYGAADIFVD